jgi:hypothetical protein
MTWVRSSSLPIADTAEGIGNTQRLQIICYLPPDCSTVTPNLCVTLLPAMTSERCHCFAPRDKSGSRMNGDARQLYRSRHSVGMAGLLQEYHTTCKRACASVCLKLLKPTLLMTSPLSCQSSRITSLYPTLSSFSCVWETVSVADHSENVSLFRTTVS